MLENFSNKTLRYLKTDLHLCGLDLDKLSDLPGRLAELLDVHLEVAKKTNGDYENVFFSRRITLSQGRSLSQAHEEADDTLLPF